MSDAGSARSIEAKRLQLNLKVLQRHDPSIVEILDSTSYVVLYKYVPAPASSDTDSQDSPVDMQWVKTSIEGSMFIFRRSQAPCYGFFILNRHGVENFSHYLEDEANLELTPEYIIVQSGDEQIKGIWVFEEEHRERLGEKMLELSRLSKHGTALSKAVASVPAHPSNNNSPGSTGSFKPLPAGQSISLDMLFGSSATNNDNQSQSNGNETDLWGPQAQSSDAPATTKQQGMNLLDSLFADLSGNTGSNTATARPSPTVVEHANVAQVGGSTSQSADEDALRSLLGLGSASPRHSKPSPGPYQQSQQHPSPHNAYSPSNPHVNLSQSQGPQPTQQQQPVLETLAPRPQRMAHFDALTYEAPTQPSQYQQQHLPSNVQQFHSASHLMQPQHPPPPPHLVQRHQRHQQQQRQAPPPQQTQQHFVSAPLMPSVLLNKNQTSQPSPPVQSRAIPSHQSQSSQPYAGQQYVPQYSPTNPNFQKYGPPPALRVKSPLSQSHTYGYTSSDYSGSDVRLGAQSIPPPPVPPVESRPPHLQQQQQQQAPRRGSGDCVQQAVSPRSSPQVGKDEPLSPHTAMDVLDETLRKTSLYQSQGSSDGAYKHSAPVDRHTFRQYLSTCLQDERFLEALYLQYLHGFEGR